MASDVTFDLNQASIKSDFYQPLRSVAFILKKYNNNNIIVSGYTDNTGEALYNQKLSENRAKSVAEFLISQGLSPHRIFTNGYGSRHPIASNHTAQGRALNRRVVITLRPKD